MKRKLAFVSMFVLLITVLGGAIVEAQGPKPDSTQHAPMAGGTFTVNDTGDGNAADSLLSLREAMLLANGGTSAGGLNRPLTTSEKAQIGGTCAFSPSGANWTINATSCGAGVADTINFAISPGNTILVTLVLPAILDSAATTIDGTGVGPLIDVSGVGLNSGIQVTSNGNTIRNVGVTGAPGSTDFFVTGDNNQFLNVWAWNATTDGFLVSGNGNTIDSARIGVFTGAFNNCGTGSLFKGNGRYGIYLVNGAASNTISNSYIGCNTSSGVFIAPSSGMGNKNNVVGPNNFIGTNSAKTADLGNGGSGVVLETNHNRVQDNTIAFNFHGIYITSTINNICGNAIISNTTNGVNLTDSAQSNNIGTSAVTCGNSPNPTQISGNGNYGISMNGVNVSSNIVYGSDIGASARYVTAQGNANGGIWISGGNKNQIRLSDVSGNSGFGIRLDNGAYTNTVLANTIFSNTADGVVLAGAATHDNEIASNDIGLNHGNGVHIIDAYANKVGRFATGWGTMISNRNWLHGVLIEGSANDNLIANAYIGLGGTGNSGSGVQLQGGAYNNTLSGNSLDGNGMDGINIGGSSTLYNHLMANDSSDNLGNGLTLWGGTHDNQIGYMLSSGANRFNANHAHGILLLSGANHNQININNITNNDKNGIELSDANTNDNQIFMTIITNNGQDGINERLGATNNTWSLVDTDANGGMGIDRNASNETQNSVTGPYPTITSVRKVGTDWQIKGTGLPSVGQTVFVEVYLASVDPSGFGEGSKILGTSVTNSAGDWTLISPGTLITAGSYLTAFETVQLSNGHSYSTEFGPNTTTSFLLYLPLIVR